MEKILHRSGGYEKLADFLASAMKGTPIKRHHPFF